MIREALQNKIIAIFQNPCWGISEIKEVIDKYEESKEIHYDELVLNASIAVQCDPELIMSKSRRREVVLGRHLVFHKMREQGYTMQAIGDKFNKHHATILFGINKLQQDLETNWKPTIDAYERFEFLNENE